MRFNLVRNTNWKNQLRSSKPHAATGQLARASQRPTQFSRFERRGPTIRKKGSNAETPKQPASLLAISQKTPKQNAETSPKHRLHQDTLQLRRSDGLISRAWKHISTRARVPFSTNVSAASRDFACGLPLGYASLRHAKRQAPVRLGTRPYPIVSIANKWRKRKRGQRPTLKTSNHLRWASRSITSPRLCLAAILPGN